MEGAMTDEEDYVVTTAAVRSRFKSRLVPYRPWKESRKNLFTRIHPLVPLYRPKKKYEDFMEDIIPAETTVPSATLKGVEQTMLHEMKPFLCDLPSDFEWLVSKVRSDEGVEFWKYISLIRTDPPYQTGRSQHMDKS